MRARFCGVPCTPPSPQALGCELPPGALLAYEQLLAEEAVADGGHARYDFGKLSDAVRGLHLAKRTYVA